MEAAALTVFVSMTPAAKGLLPDIQSCGLRMRRKRRERFCPPSWVSDPDMHHGRCVTHVPRCMPGSLTSGFFLNWWRGKRSWHSRRMLNPHFFVSGKRPMLLALWDKGVLVFHEKEFAGNIIVLQILAIPYPPVTYLLPIMTNGKPDGMCVNEANLTLVAQV